MRGLVVLALLLSGCHLMPDPLTAPQEVPPNRERPKPRVYRQCDEFGCRLYDGKGQRRYDCERGWSECKVL